MAKTSSTTTAAPEDGAAALPDFQAGKLYALQLTAPLEFPPGSGNYLRPGDSVQLDGGYCAQHKDVIGGATPVEEPVSA